MNLQDITAQTFVDALEKFKKGKIEASEMMVYVSAANTAHKLISQQIHTASISETQRKVYNVLYRKNICNDTTAIKTETDKETDYVKCYEQEKVIIRADCLEYSSTHYEDCKGCEIGRATKEILLGSKE